MSQKNQESNLKVALTAGSSPEIKQFKDIMHWFKQIMGFLVGLFLGIFKVSGFAGIIAGLLIIVVASILYAQKYLEVDEDEIENSTIVTEGFQFALMSFFVRNSFDKFEQFLLTFD